MSNESRIAIGIVLLLLAAVLAGFFWLAELSQTLIIAGSLPAIPGLILLWTGTHPSLPRELRGLATWTFMPSYFGWGLLTLAVGVAILGVHHLLFPIPVKLVVIAAMLAIPLSFFIMGNALRLTCKPCRRMLTPHVLTKTELDTLRATPETRFLLKDLGLSAESASPVLQVQYCRHCCNMVLVHGAPPSAALTGIPAQRLIANLQMTDKGLPETVL